MNASDARADALAGLKARLARAPWGEATIVIGAYLGLAILVSWPLAANIGTNISGGGAGGDQSGYVWDFWNLATNGLHVWGVDTQTAVGAPFGRESPASVNFTLLATLGPAFIVASIWSPIVAYNVTVFLALTLAASTMYLLVRWIGAGRAPAAWAGAAFMVFPYEILRAQIHVPLAHIWGLPLVILGTLFWLEKPGLRRSGVMAVTLLAAWTTSPYYGTMAGIIVASAILIGAYRAWIADGLLVAGRRLTEAAGAVVAIVLVPLALLFTAASGSIEDSLLRNPDNLSLFGARLRDYVVPPLSSSFFSGVFGADWATMGSVGGERMAFVGYVTIALAAAGVGVVLGSRGVGTRMRLAVILALTAGPILVLFSLESPSTFFGYTLDMPSSYLFEVLPYMQSFARFSAAVMALLLVVGAIGLALLLPRLSTAGKVALISGVFLLTAFELPQGAPLGRVIGSDVPLRVQGNVPDDVPLWQWLKRSTEPDAIVFETPGLPNELIERNFMYGQLVHGRRIVNGSLSVNQIGWDIQQANGFLEWPGVPERLATLGVDYVTSHPWAHDLAGYPAPDPMQPPEGFTHLRSFPDGTSVWRVTAEPDDAVAIPRTGGWFPASLEDGTVWRWMGQRATTTIYALRGGRYAVRFQARALDAGEQGVYPTRVVDRNGNTLASFVVGAETAAEFEVALPAGRTDLIIETSGPAPRHPAPGDPREVTILVGDWSVERTGPA